MKMTNELKRALFTLAILAVTITSSYADIIVGTAGGPFAGEGKVYWGDGNGKWIDISEGTRLGAAITCSVFYDGTLFIGTQSRPGYGGYGGVGQVWRYDGNKKWTLMGTLDSSVNVLAVLSGHLLAATSWGKIYLYYPRYDNNPGCWGSAGYVENSSGFRAGVVSAISGKDELYLGELNYDKFWRYNFSEGAKLIDNKWRSCVYSMKEFQGQPYAGCWHGSFYKSMDGKSFTALTAPYADHVWAMETFQGKLFVGEGDGDSNGQISLRCWDGSTMQTIKTFSVTSYAEGISAMATDGFKLFIGTGVPDGYYSGDGRAELWAYDGVNFTKLCTDDFFGACVQSITIGTFQPNIEVISARINPSKVCCGHSVLVTVDTTASFVSTKEEGLKLSLPAGWTMQPISGPQDGNGSFVTAVVVPCHQIGTFTITASIEGTTWNGNSITSSNSTSVVVESIRSVPDSELASYMALYEAILQARAWDLDLECPSFSANIPKILDLTPVGWVLKETPKYFEGAFGTTRADYFGYYNVYHTNRWSDPIASYSEYTYTPNNSTTSYNHAYEVRPWFSFNIVKPETALYAKYAVLTLTGPRYASWTYTMNMNYLSVNPQIPVNDRMLFDDCGNDLIKVIEIKGGTPYVTDVPVPDSSILSIGLNLDLSKAPYWSHTATYPGGSYSFYDKNGQLVNGTCTGYTITEKDSSIYLNSAVLTVSYTCGYSPKESLRMALDCIATNDAASAIKLASYLNSRYGYNPDQWGIRVKCEPPAVEPPPTPTVPPPSVPSYSTPLIIAKTTLNVTGNITVSGSIHSDANLIIGGNTTTAGKATYLGMLTLNGTAMNIVGGTSKVITKLFPTQAQVLTAVGAYTRIPLRRDKKGNPLRTDITAANAAKFKGVILLEGSVLITGNVTLNATIMATGNIALTGNSTVISAAGGWALYTEKGSISITGNSRTSGKVAGNLVGINALIATE